MCRACRVRTSRPPVAACAAVYARSRAASGAADAAILTFNTRSLPEMTSGVRRWPTNGVAVAPQPPESVVFATAKTKGEKKPGNARLFHRNYFERGVTQLGCCWLACPWVPLLLRTKLFDLP